MTPTIIVAMLTALSVIVPAYLTGLFSKRKVKVEAEVTLSAESRTWAEMFQKDAREAREDADKLRRRMSSLETYILQLEGILRSQGITIPTRLMEQ